VNLGARRRFTWAGRAADFRIVASNLNGAAGYWASPSGVLTPIAPRTVRALLTVTFGPTPEAPPATVTNTR
jgi:iron complex outermembrane receptor protein